jgi:ribonuclease T2
MLDATMSIEPMNVRRALAILGAVMAIAPTAAAAPACIAPRDLQPWPVQTPPPGEVQSGVTIAYYLLTISWAPEWCRTNGQGSATAQRLECGKPFGFVLHGLWPNGSAPPYPRYCRPVGGIPARLVRQMYCRTPSPELLQHEWAAHGACGWTDPQSYFKQSSRLYDRVVMPRVEKIPADELTAGVLRQAFTARNRWMRPDMIWVQTGEAQRLTEIRICHDLKFRPMSCTGGLGAPDSQRLRLTPSATRAF